VPRADGKASAHERRSAILAPGGTPAGAPRQAAGGAPRRAPTLDIVDPRGIMLPTYF